MASVLWSSSRQSRGFQHGVVASCGFKEVDTVSCRCNLQTCQRTSLIDNNPGRRLYGYPMYSGTYFGCNFFRWIDPPTCPHGQEFLPPMIRKMKKLEKKAHKHKE